MAKNYEAKIVGKDGFEKVLTLRERLPQIFIPEKKSINAYLEEPQVTSSPIRSERTFVLNETKSYKHMLVYEEL